MTRAGAMIDFIDTLDQRMMQRVQRWRPPRWFRLWMACATRGGDGWIWYALGFAILFWGGPKGFAAVAAAGLASATGITVFLSLKKMIGRRRPCALGRDFWGTFLPPNQFSFPSGHSITAFAVSVPLILFYPSLTIGLLFCAVSIAISRMVLGLHFLSDVLAGCLIGAGLGYLGFLVFS